MTIYTADGTPARPELEAAVKALDESLGLRWLISGWAVTYRWPAADLRRQMIRDGVMAPDADFDILCFLPNDCPPDQARNYLEHSCVHWARDMGRDDIARLLDHIHAHNAKQALVNEQPSLEYAEELIDANKAGIAEEMGFQYVKPVYQSEHLAHQHPEKTKRKKGKDL